MNYNIAVPFYKHATHRPSDVALVIEDRRITYSHLAGLARQTAAQIQFQLRDQSGARIGIFAGHVLEAYVAILAAAWAGGTYVAINPKWPAGRIKTLLGKAKLDLLLTDARGLEASQAWSADAQTSKWPPILQVDPVLNPNSELLISEPPSVAGDQPAYIMFTSGSTGVPKGVVIANASVHHYISWIQSRYAISRQDRVAQFSELSFDFSVLDLFMTWNGGAALYPIPTRYRLVPGEFVRKNQLTVWSSVPSVMNLMMKAKNLKPNDLAHLRLAIFCGEPLTTHVVTAVRSLSPDCKIENHYGPTEATVSCASLSVAENPKTTLNRDVIAIGKSFPTGQMAILDLKNEMNFLPAGEQGQICISGEQVSLGYFDDPEQTKERFRLLGQSKEDQTRWYLTGDLGFLDDEGDFHHLGRLDNQIKVRGHRVDLEDVESNLRRAAKTADVAAVAWPITSEGAGSIVGFVSGSAVSEEEIIEQLRGSLPVYMLPKFIRRVASLPQNSNGKLDRKKLIETLEAESP